MNCCCAESRKEWRIHTFSIPGLSSCSVLDSNGEGDSVPALLLVQLLLVCRLCASLTAGLHMQDRALLPKLQFSWSKKSWEQLQQHSVFHSAQCILHLCCVSLVCPRALTRVKCSSRSFICHDYSQCAETQGNCGQLLEGLILFFLLRGLCGTLLHLDFQLLCCSACTFSLLSLWRKPVMTGRQVRMMPRLRKCLFRWDVHLGVHLPWVLRCSLRLLAVHLNQTAKNSCTEKYWISIRSHIKHINNLLFFFY